MDHFTGGSPLKVLNQSDAGVGRTRRKLLLVLHGQKVFAPVDASGPRPFVPWLLQSRKQPPHGRVLRGKIPMVRQIAIPPVIQEIGNNHGSNPERTEFADLRCTALGNHLARSRIN